MYTNWLVAPGVGGVVGAVSGSLALGLDERFVWLFGECGLFNTILCIHHLMYCTPPVVSWNQCCPMYGFPLAPLFSLSRYNIGNGNEQGLVSLKVKKPVDAEGWCTKAVAIEGG